MPVKNLQKRLGRIGLWLSGLGISVLALNYQDRCAGLVSQEIEKNGAVLQQYWLIKASGESESDFVADNNKAHPALTAARKYNEIVCYGNLMAEILKKGVGRTSPLVLNRLSRKSRQVTDSRNADFIFPSNRPDLSLSSADSQIYTVEIAIFGHALASLKYIQLVKGDVALADALFEDTLKRHDLQFDPGKQGIFTQIETDVMQEADAVATEYQRLDEVVYHGMNDERFIRAATAMNATSAAIDTTDRDAEAVVTQINANRLPYEPRPIPDRDRRLTF